MENQNQTFNNDGKGANALGNLPQLDGRQQQQYAQQQQLLLNQSNSRANPAAANLNNSLVTGGSSLNNKMPQIGPKFGRADEENLDFSQSGAKSNFHSNDSTVLQQKVSELEAELAALDEEYEQLQLEGEQLKEEQDEIKSKNKVLFEQITQMGGANNASEEYTGYNESIANHNALNGGNSISVSNVDGGSNPQQSSQNLGDIHSLYQDLFLTDIKKEVEVAQTELKQCKQEQNNVQREMAQLKKENQQLNATLKRYRKMLQEMTYARKDDLNNVLGGFMSPSDLQKMHMMSFESVGIGANASAIDPSVAMSRSLAGDQTGVNTKGKPLKRSDSGTSSVTNLVSQATFIESAKIERLLSALNTIQQTDKVYDILTLGLKELKALINCANCTMFIFSTELQKQVNQAELSLQNLPPPNINHQPGGFPAPYQHNAPVHNFTVQKYQMENGQWIDALCESDKDLSTPGFKKPEDVKYGMKSQQFLAQPILFKDEEIIVVVQCEAKVNRKTSKYVGFQVSDYKLKSIPI